MQKSEIEIKYLENIKNYTEKLERLKKFSNYLVFIRLLSFSFIVLFFIFCFKSHFNLWPVLLLIISLFTFFFFVKRSIKLGKEKDYFSNLIRINQNELNALNHVFSCFDGGEELKDPSHPFSYDLDLFGEGSIFQQINRCISKSGKYKLANWLSFPLTNKSEIINRQEAVKELTPFLSLRQDFMATGNGFDNVNRDSILKWVDEIPSQKSLRFYENIAIILSANSLLIILLCLFQVLAFSLLFFLIAFNGIFIFSKIKSVNKEHALVSRQYEKIMQYAEQIRIIENSSFSSNVMVELKNKIFGKDHSGSKSLKQLASIINAFDYRLNFLVSIFLNGFFFWDFFCIIRLNRWKQRYHQQIKEWFEVLDEFDALQSISNYSYNNPNFIFATFQENKDIYSGKGLCHPQIEPGKRINNEITVNKKGTFLIITGPNMAGKSTFLRTVGVSIAMSQAGAPVCAEKLNIVPLTLYSSMRTADSLYRNESYFYAELKRLREIIQAASENQNIFIILDEILKGTNSKDKAEGSKGFMKKITALNATGIVATHDLSLGELENEMSETIKNYCFEADTQEDTVTFDYKLKRGITTRMNASVLMKQMGII